MVQRNCSSLLSAFSGLALAFSLQTDLAQAEGASRQSDLPSQTGLFETASAHLEKLAKQGDAKAQYQLASLYRIGRGVPQDDSLAFTWMREAANNGHARAQYSLATMYLTGRGTPADVSLAQSWARRASESGNENASALMAQIVARSQNASAQSGWNVTVANGSMLP